MDFKTQSIGAGGLCALASDALVVILVGTSVPESLETPLADVARDAVKHGDLAL